MSQRNTIDVLIKKDELIKLKNGKTKIISKIVNFDGQNLTINIYEGDN